MKPAAMDRDLRHGVPRPDTPGLHPDLLTEAVEIAELACLYSNVDKALKQIEFGQFAHGMGQKINPGAEGANCPGRFADNGRNATRIKA